MISASNKGRNAESLRVPTINGVPAFQLVPLEEDDDLVDRLIDHHPQFKRLLKKRLGEKTVSTEEASGKL